MFPVTVTRLFVYFILLIKLSSLKIEMFLVTVTHKRLFSFLDKAIILGKSEIKHQFSCTPFSTGGFFVTGINLTEDLKYICSHPTESLKDMVMSTYPTLLSWVKQQKPGSNTGSLNIIAGDFVTESQFIPTVIALNENLLNRTIIPEP